MSQLPHDRETLKRRRSKDADAIIRKVEAKLAKAKAEKVSEIIRDVKEALNGAGIDFYPREWRVEEERKEDWVSYKIIYVPTSRSFDSTGEATAYLERERNGLRADLLAALTTKLADRQDHYVSCEAWSCEWFQGKIVYHCIERHQPTFASEAEAIDFSCQGYTSRDEDIAEEFRGVIAQCDDLLGQISELFATAMSDLLASRDDSPGHGEVEVPVPLSIIAGGYEADGDDDDDEDYSDSSESGGD